MLFELLIKSLIRMMKSCAENVKAVNPLINSLNDAILNLDEN